MALRHLYGLKALAQVYHKLPETTPVIELLAVCDTNSDNAAYISQQSEDLLGVRPAVYASQAELLAGHPAIKAINITTGSETHHHLAAEALITGCNVIVEKPLASTVRGCNLAIKAAHDSGKILAVAENLRRDPQNRLVRALLQDGAIGRPSLMVELIATGAANIVLTPWRHRQESGGILMDVGVHSADLMCYFMGEVDNMSGRASLVEKVRYRAAGPATVSEFFYQKWLSNLPDNIEATAEDLLVGHIAFSSGPSGQLTLLQAAHGERRALRLIYGSQGMLELPQDRSGQPIYLRRDDLQQALTGEALLDYAPSYRLDPVSAALFGHDHPTGYQLSFEEIDQKLVAIELMDFARAVVEGRPPEVDGQAGRRAVAVIYGLIESGLLGRAVSMDEIVQDENLPYQQAINRALNL